MLTRSPIAPHSSNASPSSFHYAPHATRSPHHSPARTSTHLARRPSTPSPPTAAAGGPLLNSSSLPGRRQYVGVDVATQYSPMEPFDYAAPRRPVAAASSSSPSRSHLQHVGPGSLPGPPQPLSSGGPASQWKQPASAVAADHEIVPATPTHQPPDPSIEARRQEGPYETNQKISPPKRRSPPEAGPSEAGPAAAARSGGPTSLAKRPKTKAGPPKVLPRQYEHCDVEDMVVLISNMLGELIETNDAPNLRSGHLTRFHSRTPPGISVLDYLHRLAKHATLTPPLLLSMVYYIDRLCSLYPEFTINTLTVHRFLITAATVAAKGLSDSFWTNSLYARVGGVKVAELKLLELEFLYRVDWKIVPNPEVLVAYYRGLVERCPGYILQGDERNLADDEEDDEDDEDEDLDEEESEEDSGQSRGFRQDDIAGSVEGILAHAAGTRAEQGAG